METRGIRNCNPLNIRHSASKWQGMREEQKDKEFVQFQSMKWGIRAAMKTIITYMSKHQCDTIEKIVRRWAPATENDTEAYIRFIVNQTGLDKDDKLPTNKYFIIKIIREMAKYESGYNATLSLLEQSWELI